MSLVTSSPTAVLLMGLLALVLAFPCPAQVQDYELDWFTIDGGGGPGSDGFYSLESALGQPDAGVMSDGFYRIEGGFLTAALSSPPFIISQPVDVMADVGDDVRFVVEVTGSMPLQYQWRLNDLILEGATNASLFLVNVDLIHGGTYSVVVANEYGVVASLPASLSFPMTATPGGDNFANRVKIVSGNTLFASSNVGATREAGEPDHAGKLGGKSIWYTWTPAADGIAAFRTTGSGFDTVLAVYTGNALTALQPVAGDDDGGGSLTSAVRFNAVGGTAYQIAIDGLGGREGNVVLSWEFLATTDTLPVIISAPASRSVLPGGSTQFTVMASGTGLTYQWFLNDQPIAGANLASLPLTGINAGHLGYYTVRITNSANQFVESAAAALEIGPEADVVSFAKVEDLRFAGGLRPPIAPMLQTGGFASASLVPAGGFVPVSAGASGFQQYLNLKSQVADNCYFCDGIPGKAQWFGLLANSDGVMTLDTLGSSIDTVLLVYVDQPDAAMICNFFVGCDDNGAPDGIRSQLSFPAVTGTKYLIGVAGAQNQTDMLQLNWRLCSASSPFQVTGQGLRLATEPNPMPWLLQPEYSWYREDELLGATPGPEFFLEGLPPMPARFSVRYFSQINGMMQPVTNELGFLVHAQPGIQAGEGTATMQMRLPGVTEQPFRLEHAVTTLTNCDGGWLWVEETNFTSEPQGDAMLLNIPMETPSRFYRVRPPLPTSSLPGANE